MAQQKKSKRKTSSNKKLDNTYALAMANGIKHGYRSGLEVKIANELDELGVGYLYEDPSMVIRYTKPITNHRYTPDFKILSNGIIIETKGRFTAADRTKHLLIKEQYPDVDIRFVFSNANAKLSKKSKTTYSAWCDRHGFKWAHRTIPQAWLDE